MFKALSLMAASELGSKVSRTLRAVPYFAFAAVIFLFAIGFLLDLVHTWIALRMGSMAASGVLGGVLLVLALGALITGYSIKNKRPAKSSAFSTSALIAAPVAARFLGGKLRLGTVAVAGVVAAGAVLGRYIGRH